MPKKHDHRPTEAAPPREAPDTDPPAPRALAAQRTPDLLDEESLDDHQEFRTTLEEFPWHDGHEQPVQLVFAGGSGGVGRSLLVANIGLFLARLGRSVLVADLDPSGSNLHTYLGLEPLLPNSGALLRPPEPARIEGIAGSHLKLCRASRPLGTQSDDTLRRQTLATARAADADLLLLDVGAAPDPLTLDCFLEADSAVIVVSPSPTSLERAYAFLHAALYRRLLHGDDEPAVVSRALLSADHLSQLDDPEALIDALGGVHPNAAQAIRARLLAFTPQLLINHCRSRSEHEIAAGMVSALKRRWGIQAQTLGGLDHDDTAAEAARRRRPLIAEYPGAALARDIERVARRLLANATSREGRS